MSDVTKLRAQYSELVSKARQLSTDAGDSMTEDVAAQIDELLGKADAIRVSLQREQQIADAQAFGEDAAPMKAAHLGWREAGPDEGNPKRTDAQSWHDIDLGGGRKQRVWLPEFSHKADYASAFESYLRKGIREVGPQDSKTLSEGSDSAGGFLVPAEFYEELVKKTATMATIRAAARVVQTSRDAARWPRVKYDADDEYTSGARMTWTGEAPASSTVHRVTDPVFGLITIPVHTAMASMPMHNDLIEDAAFDVIGMAGELLGEAFALGENDAFVNGNGVNRPMGILTKVDDTEVTGPRSVVSGTDNAITADGLIDLEGALPAQYEPNARFVMNKATRTAIRKLKYTTSGEYVWPEPAGGGLASATDRILGYPVLRDEALPDITTDGYPVIFGDLSAYLVLDRVGLSVQRLSEVYAEQNLTVLLARRRVGGQLLMPWRIKVQKTSAS